MRYLPTNRILASPFSKMVCASCEMAVSEENAILDGFASRDLDRGSDVRPGTLDLTQVDTMIVVQFRGQIRAPLSEPNSAVSFARFILF